MYDLLRDRFNQMIEEHGLGTEEVRISAKPLSPQEAIGNPEEDDYPLLKGRERLMQAELRGTIGQAFTDMYGNYEGRASEIASMDLRNNYRRAIFISSLNAISRYLGHIERSIHCKDTDPKECAKILVRQIESEYRNPKIALVGLQPRMAEALSAKFQLKTTDLSPEDIGREVCGVLVEGPDKTHENLQWCDVAIVTGTTIVNCTVGEFVKLEKPLIFYGISIAGAAHLMGLKHYCPLSR